MSWILDNEDLGEMGRIFMMGSPDDLVGMRATFKVHGVRTGRFSSDEGPWPLHHPPSKYDNGKVIQGEVVHKPKELE